MANNFTKNFTERVMLKIIPAFETARVLSKNVNTQLFSGEFNANTGELIRVKRPTDYLSIRTTDGDITGTKRDIITGTAFAEVQDYITVPIDFKEADQALKMGTDADRFWQDAANRIVVDLELDFAKFMMRNTGLLSGTYGTAITKWDHVARAGSTLKASGVPEGAPWFYTVNPFAQSTLASDQRSLGAGGVAGQMIETAHEMATLTRRFAGFDRVMTATGLGTFTSDSEADRIGSLSANPDVSYVTAKDTMQQNLVVENFGNDLEIRAGETIQITGRNRLNLSTREIILDANQNPIVFTGTVVADVTLSATGTGTIVITGPAIFEAAGGYNTTDTAAVSGDVVTVLGAASKTVQPNLFWHRDAFSIVSIPIDKLFATDTTGTTQDGMQLRVSRFSDGNANLQTIRLDLRPAYAVLDPFMAGQSFGFS